ncbi:ComEA family DNA-binding protein [Pseudoclavibacter chungangensis]|uniref:ComEA family DNA-binding protein n=1 Tax=Pseudoclavibacter chungangensis TaxID=587635 RepID=A0A7J5BQR5_9MICO|nr:ComEA family DNA-binding protein [Pseudoclavibacter chungangensis]
MLGPDRGPRWRVGVGAAVVLVLVALAATVLLTALRPGTTSVVEPMTTAAGESPVEAAPADGTANAEPSVTASASLIVHVSGAVLAPGVHELADGSRVLDAVQAAGGFAEGADEQALNLARPIVDGEQIRVPVLGEAAPPEHAAPDGATSLVNLNTASSDELQELPGVGEAIAGRIIAYREEHGGFTSVDELLQVSGIGEATFAELEALVTV